MSLIRLFRCDLHVGSALVISATITTTWHLTLYPPMKTARSYATFDPFSTTVSFLFYFSFLITFSPPSSQRLIMAFPAYCFYGWTSFVKMCWARPKTAHYCQFCFETWLAGCYRFYHRCLGPFQSCMCHTPPLPGSRPQLPKQNCQVSGFQTTTRTWKSFKKLFQTIWTLNWHGVVSNKFWTRSFLRLDLCC